MTSKNQSLATAVMCDHIAACLDRLQQLTQYADNHMDRDPADVTWADANAAATLHRLLDEAMVIMGLQEEE